MVACTTVSCDAIRKSSPAAFVYLGSLRTDALNGANSYFASWRFIAFLFSDFFSASLRT